MESLGKVSPCTNFLCEVEFSKINNYYQLYNLNSVESNIKFHREFSVNFIENSGSQRISLVTSQRNFQISLTKSHTHLCDFLWPSRENFSGLPFSPEKFLFSKPKEIHLNQINFPNPEKFAKRWKSQCIRKVLSIFRAFRVFKVRTPQIHTLNLSLSCL